jgi:subtilisin-like proprotein convertase family protein
MRAPALAALVLAALSASAEWRLELVRESLTLKHCRYREYVDGVPGDDYITAPCEAGTSVPRYLGTSELRRFGGRVLRREIGSDALRPFARDYDVETGALVRSVPLFFHAKEGRVFDPNPVASLNDPSLQDQNDSNAAVPETAYRFVELLGVVESGPLRGPFAMLVDKQAPNVAPPDASGSLLFRRADDGFEDVNAYFHIDRTQRYLQSLGYRNARAIAPYAVEVDAHAAAGLDNSVFVPSASLPGTGTLYFGEGGTDDAEDADLVVHEYAHALHEWISPGSFTGSFASEARAVSEGFGDYWAFSSHYAQRVASGRDPFCFADWDARCWLDDASQQCAYPPGTDCLRRLDSTRTMNDYERGETSGVEHRNGAIWSSALREIFLQLGKEITDTLVLESLFGVPPQPSFAVMARRLIDADRLLYNGAHGAVICDVMKSRFILTDCVNLPRGESTHFQSVAGLPIPEANPAGVTSTLTIADTRVVERLFVRVDIDHPSRGDLKIELIAPDGTVTVLQQISFDRARDVHVLFGPLRELEGRSAAGVWQLRVSDLRLRDVGTFLSWGLTIQFAGDEPSTARPRGAREQMVAAVTHRHGANETFFTSDLRIANITSARQTATLIFTPSGEDGLASFSAANISIEPGQTLAFDDVLQSVFATSGTGSLQILGDVIAESRTHTPRIAGGTLGLHMPLIRHTTARNEPELHAAGWSDPGYRYNLGITEVSGSRGVVQIDNMLTIAIAPFSHVQIPSGAASTVRVIEGEARVGVYLAQIDNAGGDSILVPAEPLPPAGTFIAPATDTPGLGGTAWQSDVWTRGEIHGNAFNIDFIDNRLGDAVTQLYRPLDQAPRVLESRYARPGSFGMLAAHANGDTILRSRIRGANGTAQFVPFRTPDGPLEQHLLFIENNAGYRTNIGVVANERAVAEVIVFDSNGAEVQRALLFTNRGIAQIPVNATLTAGRARVRFLEGRGRAYASMIDNRSTDALYVEGQ